MGIFSWIVFGLLAGFVARIVAPGRNRLGCLTTLIVGIAGAFIGGLIGDVILGHKVHYSFDPVPFLFAVVGAVVLLLALQAVSGRRGPL